VYTDDKLIILTTEGRVIVSGTNYTYEYWLKDHLGNTRLAFSDGDNDGTPEVMQNTDYYPFGMTQNRRRPKIPLQRKRNAGWGGKSGVVGLWGEDV
jgi:hypothetical protein